MLPYDSQVGQQEDWAQFITNVAMIDTPLTAWLPVGEGLVSTRFDYQADIYRNPEDNSHPDGVEVTNDKSAGENRKELNMYCHYWTKKASISALSQSFGNVAGIGNAAGSTSAGEMGREIRIQTEELRKEWECHWLSPVEARRGVHNTVGYRSRGVPNWILASAQGVLPVDSTIWPAAGQINTSTASAALTEDNVLDIFQSIYTTTRKSMIHTVFCGPKAQRSFNNFPIFTPASASAVNGGSYPSPVRGGAFDRNINRYVTPFGSADLVPSANLHSFNSSVVFQSTRTAVQDAPFFILHQDMWEVRWGTLNGGSGQPKWLENPYAGGKRSAFCEAVNMLVCKNPQGEGRYSPTS